MLSGGGKVLDCAAGCVVVGRPPLRLCGGGCGPSLAPRQRAIPLGRATRVRESSPPRPSMTVGRPPEVRAAVVGRAPLASHGIAIGRPPRGIRPWRGLIRPSIRQTAASASARPRHGRRWRARACLRELAAGTCPRDFPLDFQPKCRERYGPGGRVLGGGLLLLFGWPDGRGRGGGWVRWEIPFWRGKSASPPLRLAPLRLVSLLCFALCGGLATTGVFARPLWDVGWREGVHALSALRPSLGRRGISQLR